MCKQFSLSPLQIYKNMQKLQDLKNYRLRTFQVILSHPSKVIGEPSSFVGKREGSKIKWHMNKLPASLKHLHEENILKIVIFYINTHS